MSDQESFQGELSVEDMATEENVLFAMMRRFIGQKCFSGLVVVESVTVPDALSPVGMVTVKPMVHQVQADGVVMPHNKIYNLPYFRLQGGVNAVVIDPVVGDIGMAIFADRDISVVKETRQAGAPGSKRRNHFSDGLYVGGFLNGTPSQYLWFKNGGIVIHSPSKVTIEAPEVELVGNLSVSGDVTAIGEVMGKGIPLSDHEHGGVESGGSNTGKPVA